MRIAPFLLAGSLLASTALGGEPPPPETDQDAPAKEQATPSPAEAPAPEAEQAEQAEPAGQTAADPIQLAVDPAASTVYARVHAAGLGGHEHVIDAAEIAGTATWHPDDPPASQIALQVDVTGLVPDSDAMREAVGLEGTLSANQQRKIRKGMLARDQLWAERYGLVQFASTDLERTGDDTLSVTGDFTLRGETHPITVEIDWQPRDEGYRARGQFTIQHTDFGFEPYSAVLGALRNADPVDIHLDIALERQGGSG